MYGNKIIQILNSLNYLNMRIFQHLAARNEMAVEPILPSSKSSRGTAPRTPIGYNPKLSMVFYKRGSKLATEE